MNFTTGGLEAELGAGFHVLETTVQCLKAGEAYGGIIIQVSNVRLTRLRLHGAAIVCSLSTVTVIGNAFNCCCLLLLRRA